MSAQKKTSTSIGGPRHPGRQMQYQRDTRKTISNMASENRLILGRKSSNSENHTDSAVVQEMRSQRMSKQASDATIAYPKTREPFYSWKDKGIPYEVEKKEERVKIRQWARNFYRTHALQAICIDVYSRFPVQGMELTCKDPELVKFYEQLFFENLDYENALIDYGREFWTAGEVNLLGSWNETLGVWDAEEVLNPDDVTARWSAFDRDYEYRITIPDYLREIIETQTPIWEYEMLEANYPEIIDAVRGEGLNANSGEWDRAGLDVSNILLSRFINKTSPWDLYGTPHMMRCFRQLMMEETLNAAQDAIADRLYSPFILAKLGLTDAGDGQPWIPDQEEIGSFRDDINTALAADFRLLVHHFGADIKSVFGRENMPRFDQDYDRLEKKMLQVWGIGEALLSGSSNGAYASSALNRELVTQLLSSYQKWIIKHYKKRAMVVAEAQEHFDYEVSGGIRRPIYQEVLEVDEVTGEERIVKKPKLLIPDLKFATMNLRDEATERTFLQTMKNAGVPISDRTFMVTTDIDFSEELDTIEKEKVQKVVAEAEVKKKTEQALKAKGLVEFGPDEFKPKPVQTPADIAGIAGDDTPGDPNDPDAPGGSQIGGGNPFGGGNTSGDAAAADSPDEAMPDITDPAPTPNVAPQDEDAEGDGEGAPEGASDDNDAKEETKGNGKLPRNRIKQRPSISDEQRKHAPRAARLKNGPAHLGFANQLTEEEVQDAINERNWTESL